MPRLPSSKVLADRVSSASIADINDITQQATKLGPFTNIKYYGAIGDGVTNDRPAFNTASSFGKDIVIPSGNYLIDSDVTINPNVEFQNGVLIQLPSGVTLTINGKLSANKYEQIFDCDPYARINLKQEHSICWYGASPNGNNDSGPAIQQAIWNAIQANVSGYQQGPGGKVYIPLGNYHCHTPIIYYGASGPGLTIYGEPDTGSWTGGTNTSVLTWFGNAPEFFTLSGTNGCCIKDINIISEAGGNVEKILWINAKNGDPGADPAWDRPTTGTQLKNVRIAIGASGDCSPDTVLVAVGHDILPGGSSSQCDTFYFHDLYLLGRGGNEDISSSGIGIRWYGGGNAKVCHMDKIATIGLQTGIKGVFTGHFVIKDWGGGGNDYDMEQDGAGSVLVLGMNSEYSRGLIKQTAGANACNASFNAVEWAGTANLYQNAVVRVRGYVELNGVTLSSAAPNADENTYTPWIVLDNTSSELDPTTHLANLNSLSLSLRGVTFNKAYSDGTFLYPPIKDGNGNPVYESNGYLTQKRQRIFVDGCTTLQYWSGMYHGVGTGEEPQALLIKPNGPAELTEYLQSDLYYTRINHNSLVTTMGRNSLYDGLGRTYHYDVTSSTSVDNNYVEMGPSGTGRYHRMISASEKIGNTTIIAEPVLTIAGSTTNGHHVNITPTSGLGDNSHLLHIDALASTYNFGLYQQGSASDTFYTEQYNYHATGNTQSHIRSTGGDSSIRLSSSGTLRQWTFGLDASDDYSFKIDEHYLPGAATALKIDRTTYNARFYGNLTANNGTFFGTFTIDPTSINDGDKVLLIDAPTNVYSYGVYQQGNSSDTFFTEQYNYHATGHTQSRIRSTMGDSSLLLSTSGTNRQWAVGIDASDNYSFKIDEHYLVGSATAFEIDRTTYEATHYGPVRFSGTNHGGIRLNSLTTTQQNALTPGNGDLIYNSTTNKLRGYENSKWNNLLPLKTRVSGNITTGLADPLINITGLSGNLVSGINYIGSICLFCDNTVPADGITIDFDGGSVGVSSFRAQTIITDSGGMRAFSQTTALSTDIDATEINGNTIVDIKFGLVCNSGGPFIPRCGLESETTGTLTIYPNSHMIIEEVP